MNKLLWESKVKALKILCKKDKRRYHFFNKKILYF